MSKIFGSSDRSLHESMFIEVESPSASMTVIFFASVFAPARPVSIIIFSIKFFTAAFFGVSVRLDPFSSTSYSPESIFPVYTPDIWPNRRFASSGFASVNFFHEPF